MITCDRCNVTKDRRKFYFDYTSPTNRKSTCIKCYNKHKPEKVTLVDPRRNQDAKGLNLVIYKKSAGVGISKRIYNGSTKPTFLQYNQLIYTHVKQDYGLSYQDLNLMFILYPIIPFNKKDYRSCRKLTEYRGSSPFKMLVSDGWIFKWKKNLYDFTDKGKRLMRDCHMWALGKKIIPDPITEEVIDLFLKIQRKRR